MERSFPLGGQDQIRVDLEAGQHIRFFFYGRDLELTVRLLGPAGEEIVEGYGAEGHLSWITSTPGAHRLIVTSPGAKTAGRYQLTLQQLSRAGQNDRERVAADADLSSARRARAEKSYDQAIRQARTALEGWTAIQDRNGELEALLELGDIYQQQGSNEDALCWYRQAAQQALVTGDLRSQARVWTALGKAFATPTDSEDANPYFETALPIWRSLEDSYQQAWALYYLGTGRYQQGRIDEAIDLLRQAAALADSAPDVAPDIQNLLGNSYLARGESQRAFECFQQGLILADKAGKIGAKATLLTQLGKRYRRRGEFRKAFDAFKQALSINQEDPDLRTYSPSVLNHIGTVYLDLGQTEAALREFQQAFADGAMRSVLQIGQAELALDRNQEALVSFQKALELAERTHSPKDQGAALHFIGVTQLKLNRPQEALRSLQKALPIREETDRLGVALTQQKLGKVYMALDDLGPARNALVEALQIAGAVGAPFFRAPILFDLALLEQRQGDLRQAVSRMEEAITVLEAVRSELSDDRSRTSFFASKRSYYDFYVDLLMELNDRNPGHGYDDEALAASEKAHGRGLLDLLAQGRLELTRGISADLRREEEEVRALRSQIQGDLLEALSSRTSDKEKEGARLASIATLESQQQELDRKQREIEQRIKTESPLYYQIRYPSPLRREEIQKLIAPDEAFLEYSFGQQGAYLFLVTTEGLRVHRLSLSPQQIIAAVKKIQSGLESPEYPSSLFRAKAYELYQVLIAPAQDEIGGKNRLLIAPDGALSYLPFEALATRPAVSGDDLPYLIERLSVSYVPSASVLYSLSLPRSPVPVGGGPLTRFLGFAPTYPASPPQVQAGNTELGNLRGDFVAGAFPTLAGAQREVHEIASLYSPDEVKVYIGSEASRKNVEKEPLVADRIHFAGHGVLDEEHPEESALVLTDGNLRVSDIFNLELKSDLVVLAACKSAGKEVTGEGLVGLTRAFLYAGAPSVMVTLWEVVDSSTSGLMVEFYKNLDGTRDEAESLRQAKLAMIDKKGRLAFPYYWAPFILVGKSR